MLVKDIKYITGNLAHSVVVFSDKKKKDVLKYDLENYTNAPCKIGIIYTGRPIDDVEYNDDIKPSKAVIY